VKTGTLGPSGDFAQLKRMDAIIICVPTPLTKFREPDLRFIVKTGEEVARHLGKGQIVVLESSTYPGTTTEVLKPILERGGLKSGRDFHLAYSPEREDPGNETYGTATIPKVVGGDGAKALKLAKQLYDGVVVKTVPVSSPETAEAIKLTENIFRAVNIAMVNELKVIFDAMGIDVWEVIEAAKTKPFGFMPFYPGPWPRRTLHPDRPFLSHLEGAGVWHQHPLYRIGRRDQHADAALRGRTPCGSLERACRPRPEKGEDPDDRSCLQEEHRRHAREPSLVLIGMLEAAGALVEYHDPFIARIKPSREHGHLTDRRSVSLSARRIASGGRRC
jgi:UDP-N-acetyl-D-glucosamine dehydrogenase